MNMIFKILIAIILIAVGIWVIRSWKKKYNKDPKSTAITDFFDSIFFFGPDLIFGILLILIGSGFLIYYVLELLGLV